MNTLQSLVLPNLDVHADAEMYVRHNEKAWASLATPALHFEAGGVVSTDTFYNGLTVGAWKRHCSVRSLVLRLAGEGRFVVTVGLHRLAQATVWLGECSVQLSPGQPADLPIDPWEGLRDGLLFVRIRALTTGQIDGSDFLTPDEPVRDVRLGLVITHFNRQAQVGPAIARIAALLDRPDLRDHLTLTVVDNSRNLAVPAHPAIEHIPNRNLGGTGGFVRGLLALIDGGRHTHALFMDDDASCETESIARTFAMLRYSDRPRLAVAGALLRELAPWQLFEKGARFDGKVEPLHSGLDMRRVGDLLEAERSLVRPDYGAWWFFAFPIAEIRQYPFPFFVRGDDIFFGLGNAFEITTLNGVACYGEDFGAKHGPLTAYLDARYHLVHALLAQRRTVKRILWVGTRLFIKALTSYQYTSARAVTLAMRHVRTGPAFFRGNLDLQDVRSEIGTWTPSEKMAPLEIDGLPVRGPRRRPEAKLRRLARLLTLQGFLLPNALLMNRTTVQEKAFHGSASAVFRYRRVLYHHAPSGTGYLAVYDRPRFFAELRSFIQALGKLLLEVGRLRRDYSEGFAGMTTLEFWRAVYPEAPASTQTTDPSVQHAAEPETAEA